MEKYLRKCLVYLIAMGLVLPTWLMVGVTKAPHAKAAEDITLPRIENLSVDSSKNGGDKSALNSSANIYTLTTDNNSATNYSLQFGTTTVASEPLSANTYELKLADHNTPTSILESYYASKPEPYKSWLNGAANGINPFAYIKADGTNKIQLLDGALYGLNRTEADMRIPGDFPEGIYNISGQITDLAGNKGDVTFTLKISDGVKPNATSDVADEGVVTRESHLTFNWSNSADANVSGVAYYQFWLSTATNENSALALAPSTWKKVEGTSYTLNDADVAMLKSGETYYAKVKAVDYANNVANDSSWSNGIKFDATQPIISGVTDGKVYANPVAITFNEGTGKLNNADFASGGTVSDPGEYDLLVTDDAGNQTIVSFRIVALQPGQQLLTEPEMTITDGTANIFVPKEYTGDSTLTVPEDVNQAKLDLSDFVPNRETQRISLGGKITIIKKTQVGDVIFEIPAGEIEGLTAERTINLPSISEVTVPINAGYYTLVSNAISIGYTDKSLRLENPVKITFKGESGKSVGYTGADGSFRNINNQCDNQDSPSLENPGECAFYANEDLVIWTNHFTSFATYNTYEVLAPDFTASGYEKDGSKWIKVTWTGNNADEYRVVIGNTSNTIAKKADESTPYAAEIKVLDYGQYKVSVLAVKKGAVSQRYNTTLVSLVAPVVVTAAASVSEAAPVVTVAPSSAKAANSASANSNANTNTNSDENGKIKGEETNSNSDNNSNNNEDKVNWTPWIVLFILILLAGAATGGYFYWFNGEDDEEIKTVVKEAKAPEAPKKPVTPPTPPASNNSNSAKKKNSSKKQKRW